MATEKYFVFSESGELKRMKGRIVRFLDNEDPSGSDKSAIRTSLEVSPDAAGLVQADVGTAPNEIPVNGMLGDMAYQSSDGVSVAELQGDNIGLNASPTDARLTITDSTNDCIHLTADESTIQGPYADTQIRMGGNIVVKGVNNAFLTTGSNTGIAVDSAGRVGIGNSSPGSFALGANELVVGDGAAGRGITVYGSPSTGGSLYFADGTTGTAKERGFIYYNHAADEMRFGTAADTRWTINSTGNLVAGANLGIDFGSVAGGTGTPAANGGLLDDFETGTWSGTYVPQTGTFTTMTMNTDLVYTKVGNLVHVSGFIETNDVDITGGSNGLKITGLPFTCAKPSAISIGFAWNWNTAAPLAGYIYSSGDAIWLQTRSSTTARTDGFNVTNMYTGAATGRNVLYLEATYQTS